MREEDRIQEACVEWLTLRENQGRLSFFAVPNGARLAGGMKQAVKLKRTGMRPGVPDLVILFPRGRTLFIEIKTPKGRKSKAQERWRGRLSDLNFHVFVARSLDELIGFVNAFDIQGLATERAARMVGA